MLSFEQVDGVRPNAGCDNLAYLAWSPSPSNQPKSNHYIESVETPGDKGAGRRDAVKPADVSQGVRCACSFSAAGRRGSAIAVSLVLALVADG